jgi:hypothetical protein
LEVENYAWLGLTARATDPHKRLTLTISPDEAAHSLKMLILVGALHTRLPRIRLTMMSACSKTGNITRVHCLLHISVDRVVIANSNTGETIQQFNRPQQFPVGDDVSL